MAYQQALAAIAAANQADNWVAMIAGMRDLAMSIYEVNITRAVELTRLAAYQVLLESSPKQVQLHCADMARVDLEKGHIDIALKNEVDGLRLGIPPMIRSRMEIWEPSGKPRFNALFRAGDLQDPLDGVQASWRWLLTEISPVFVPGDRRIYLLTDKKVSCGDGLDCSFDGDNRYGTAVRSFLPIHVAHSEIDGEFFHLLNMRAFLDEALLLRERVRKGGHQLVCVAAGHRDVKVMLQEEPNFLEIGKKLKQRLELLASIIEVKVVFGGLVQHGTMQEQKTIRRIHRELFKMGHSLLLENVIFVDCCSTSRLIPGYLTHEFNGDFLLKTKASMLFALSSLVVLTLDNLIVPTPWFKATQNELEFVSFMQKKRANINYE